MKTCWIFSATRAGPNEMWIVALILLAAASTSASAAPLHLSCKGNVVNVVEETPEPATVLVRVENYELMQLSGDENDDIWKFSRRDKNIVWFGKINRITGQTEIRIETGMLRRSFEGVCHKVGRLF
jgi:hypothetical protein